jgi:hypothetical protein
LPWDHVTVDQRVGAGVADEARDLAEDFQSVP